MFWSLKVTNFKHFDPSYKEPKCIKTCNL